MENSDLIFSASGIRGIYGKELNTEVAKKIAIAFGLWIKSKSTDRRIVIGRDTRPSGKQLKEAMIDGLILSSCDVIDLGICPTPAIIYEVTPKGDKRDGGIEVCCMFNPNQYVISQTNSYNLKANSKAKNKVELTRAGDQTLSLKRLIFDVYMESEDQEQGHDPKQKHKSGVTEKTRMLWQLMEPVKTGKGKKRATRKKL